MISPIRLLKDAPRLLPKTVLCDRLLLLAILVVSFSTVTVHGGGPSGEKPPQNSTVLKPGEILIGNRKASSTRIIVKLKAQDAQVQATQLTPLLGGLGLKKSESSKLRHVKGAAILTRDETKGPKDFTAEQLSAKMRELLKSGLFEYVQPDWVYTTQAAPTDAALAFGTLWGLHNQGQNGGTAGVDINVLPAWNLTTGQNTVVVGVIDTGIRFTHSDLRGQVWKNSAETPGNGVDDDNNGYIDDVHGINAIDESGNPMDDNNHGTHCAGTIAAAANNSQAHVGVAYNVRVMALKFLDASGSGYSSDAVECINYAIDKGAHVLSNSWGGGPEDLLLLDAINAANQVGILFVAAAGNDYSDNDQAPAYPANYAVPNVISVAAIDRAGEKAEFSNYGLQTVHLGAPGVQIFSSLGSSDFSYDLYDGTSMATPHVAGVAALVKSRYPNASLSEIKGRVLSTRPLASMAGITITGGIVDAYRALTAAPDGVIELSAASKSKLLAGQTNDFYVFVNDITPVVGATVHGRLASSPAVPFLDNGVAPDLSANDGIYSARLDVPTGYSGIILQVTATAPNHAAAAANIPFRVLNPPPNDHFANRVFLAAGTIQVRANNQAATVEAGERIIPEGDTKTLWWEWTPQSDGSATISTQGGAWELTLSIYRNNGNLSNLSLVAETLEGYTGVTFDAVAGERYCIQVNNTPGGGGDVVLNYPPPAPYKTLIAEPKK